MMTQPLFMDRKIEFEKVGGSLTRLSDNIDTWPQEIMQEAYNKLPYLSHFEVNVIIDKMDEGRGFAFGSIEVKPHSDMPDSRKRGRLSVVHIPVIVKEQMMAPLDVFLYGKRYNHLTEGRLRAALFRPEVFDSVQERPPEALIGTDLQPPALTGSSYGFGGISKLGQGPAMPQAPTPPTPAPAAPSQAAAAPARQAMSAPPSPPPQVASAPAPPAPMAKVATVTPLLPQLHGRVRQDHVDRIKTAMADPNLQVAYANADEGVRAALESAMGLEPSDPEKTAELLADSIKPDVVQLVKKANGRYMVKWAAADAYSPDQSEVSQDEASGMMGEGPLTEQLDEEGSVTAGPESDIAQALEEDTEIRAVDQFGMWLVQDTMGNQILGWVFPKVYTLDMTPMPSDLFTNGSQYAFQESIAGKMVGKSTDIPKGAVQGYGTLFYIDGGTAKAFVPMTIKGTFTDPEGMNHFVAETDLGEQVTFFFSEQLKSIAKVGDGQVIIPSCYRWLPLKAQTDLVDDPSLFTKTANKKWSGTVEIRGDGDRFSFSGPSVMKLAADQTQFVDRNHAEFLSVLMGMDPTFTKVALDEAALGMKPVAVSGTRTITPLSEKYAAAKASVMGELSELEHPIRNYFLLKEASALDDALTADKILGLGFINAENVATFVDMLPALDETSSKLAELLVAVRVGLKDVSEVAVERMLVALEDVINGLRTLQQKEIKFGD